jgi:hypothetical protein
MSAGGIFILDLKGKCLISRLYRDDLPRNIIKKFTKKVIEEEEERDIRPIFEVDGFSFAHIKHKNLYRKYNY